MTRTSRRRRTPVPFARVRDALAGRRQVVICEECELSGGPFVPAEAEHLRATHAALHHGQPMPHQRSPLPGTDG